MSDTANQFLTDFINAGRYGEIAESAHNVWLESKRSKGWRYGLERDAGKKTNPMMMPFVDLPENIRGANSLTPYAVANYLRQKFKNSNLVEFSQAMKKLLAGEDDELFDSLGEYIHSHFMIHLLSKGETTHTRSDMVVYEDLDAETKSWDTTIGLEVVRYLLIEVEKEL